MSDFTPEDLQAWRVENPWDADIPDEEIAGWFGFQWFVVGRRCAEVGGVVREEWERATEKMARQRDRFIRRFFNS